MVLRTLSTEHPEGDRAVYANHLELFVVFTGRCGCEGMWCGCEGMWCGYEGMWCGLGKEMQIGKGDMDSDECM